MTGVSVYDLPKVGIMSSGDEVVDPFMIEEPKFGQIRDSNRSMLISAIQEAEPVYCHALTKDYVVDLGIAKDVKEDIEKTIVAALQRVDIIITTGYVHSSLLTNLLEAYPWVSWILSNLCCRN